MSFDQAFYLIDHRLLALAMVVLLVAAGEIGYRRGLFRRQSKESVRSLMSGTGAAMLGGKTWRKPSRLAFQTISRAIRLSPGTQTR